MGGDIFDGVEILQGERRLDRIGGVMSEIMRILFFAIDKVERTNDADALAVVTDIVQSWKIIEAGGAVKHSAAGFAVSGVNFDDAAQLKKWIKNELKEVQK